jgi:hypothetical protein
MSDPRCLDRESFAAPDLVHRFPPRLFHPNKQAVHRVACPPGSVARGTVGFSRWEAAALPAAPAVRLVVTPIQGLFEYPGKIEGWVDWHVNFADPHLFFAYSGGLLAQDELQVAEHPALGSLLEALQSMGRRALTVDEGQPTPVLVTGVERRCELDTAPDAEQGRLYGLYGNRFSRAKVEQIEAATRRLDPPPISNILAIAAIAGGRGRYSREEIEITLATAFSGFRAAVIESAALDPGARVRIRTGFWGCGAFGGDQVLMGAIQVIAAALAGLDELVFYTFDDDGDAAFKKAEKLARTLLASGATASIVAGLVDQGFAWGQSNGT